MWKIFQALFLATVMMVSVMYSPVLAQQQTQTTRDESAGIIGNGEIPLYGWHAEFTALPKADREGNHGTLRLWSDEVERQLEFRITELVVQENAVRFIAQCNYDSLGGSHVGRWLVVEAIDSRETGVPDEVGWDWSSGYDAEAAQHHLLQENLLPLHWPLQGQIITTQS